MVNNIHFKNLNTNLSEAELDCGKLAIIITSFEQNIAIYLQKPTLNGISAIAKEIETDDEKLRILSTIETLIKKINEKHEIPYPPYCENYISEIYKVWKNNRNQGVTTKII
ncbi:hypothetical protein BK784_13240 [Bacillus thuringiensis serovar medellin]|uniref:Uncharacterized protein n=1 Tax=Bacillus thuringiensis subsp. medellin TaxID=79672 RepID=A0A9X6N450_BACTV|nr:hypothetical protein [Bacillus thuringiensis]OUC01269.1 hypothetical protein BK784_13240 [Bacillus thuringiensis serovar medellin]